MKKNILFVGSHPDDIELGCLGSILYFAKQGHEIHCIVATDGEGGMCQNQSNDDVSRRDESIKALTGAGVKIENIKFLHLADRQLTIHSLKVIEEMEKLLKEKNISWVFLQTEHDTHQDHKALHDAAMSAARNTANVLIYESSSSTTTKFSPNYFIDISPFIDQKVRLLEHHKSQQGKNYMEVYRVQGLSRYRAAQSKNASYAEAFEVFRLLDGNNGDGGHKNGDSHSGSSADLA